jgi:hypothetical protein
VPVKRGCGEDLKTPHQLHLLLVKNYRHRCMLVTAEAGCFHGVRLYHFDNVLAFSLVHVHSSIKYIPPQISMYKVSHLFQSANRSFSTIIITLTGNLGHPSIAEEASEPGSCLRLEAQIFHPVASSLFSSSSRSDGHHGGGCKLALEPSCM